MTANLKRVESDRLPVFDNAQSWRGPDMAARTDWIYELDASEIGEIDQAVSVFERSGADLVGMRRSDFPLGALAGRMASLRHDLLHGRGFFLVRNVPVERYTTQQAAAAFLGLGLHLGEPVSQNGKGHILGHVKNLGADFSDPETRGYQTNSQLAFHTDFSDFVGLLCLKTPKEGGASSLASSTTVWNEMVKRRPDLAQALTAPVCYTRWGEIEPGQRRYSEVPVFTPHDGRMIVFFNARRTIMKAQAFPEVPRVTSQQLEALDLLESIVHDPAIHMDMVLRTGDMQFLCNHYLFHTRTSYEDWPEMARRRHLLRLWLACEEGPALPAFMTEFQGRTASGRPAGIHVPGVPFKAPLEAE
ncbi:MAG TPA: TauD/TfdA family dioxygenase [Ramlibacter sp.]|nr:TauD/TfdA family dioxygenase [Ramlibacter sp.]